MALHRIILDNGMRVLVEEMSERGLAVLNIRVGAGWVQELEKEQGVAHFVEHMLFQGSTKYPTHAALTSSVEAKGGQLNGATAPEYASLTTLGPAEHLPQMLDTLLDMIAKPRLEAAAIDRERSVLLSELEGLEQEPLNWMLHHINGLLWPRHPISEELEGARLALPSLTRDDLCAFHERLYRPNNMVFAAGGRVDPQWLVSALETCFRTPPGPLMSVSPLSCEPGPRVFLIPQEENVCYLLLAFPAPTYGDQDRPAAEILHTLLGGGMSARLYHALRIDQGLAHHVETFYDKFGLAGVLGIYLEFPVDVLAQVVQVTLRQIRILSEEGIAEAELARAQALYKGNCLLEFDSTWSRVRHLALTEYLSGHVQSCDAETQCTASIGPNDVRQIAQKYLRADRAVLCMHGPVREPPLLENQLTDWLNSGLPRSAQD